MKQLVKLEGSGNVQMLEADVPQPDLDGVVVKVKRDLISRGRSHSSGTWPKRRSR